MQPLAAAARRRGGGGRLVVTLTFLLLAVSRSAVAFCPVGCLCDDDKLQVTCDDVNLEVIPITLNPSVERLVLRKNKIKSIDTALRFYVGIVFVDFSHNRLVAIQNRSFEAQRKLTELRLDHNKISSISNDMWIGLTSLTILSLRDNYISSLDERSFASCSKIRELDLGQNRIEHLDPQAFAALPELRILYLDDNKLGYNSPPSFPAFLQPLNQLAELNMAKNELPWLADGLFSSLPELSQLDVSGCKLRNVSSLAFSGLDRLRVLKLHDNLLSAVPTSAWALLGQLETLTIGQNNMTTLGAEAFTGLGRLKQLDVSNVAQLNSVHPEALNANQDLVQLRMNNCKQLATLPEQLLARTVNLRRLHLRDNGLVTLPEKFLLGVQLEELDLSDNSFHCDCQLAWLRDYILRGGSNNNILATPTHPKRSSSINAESAMELFGQLSQLDLLSCVSPPLVAKMNLQSLSDDQLGCRMSLLSSPQSIVVGLSVAGAAIVLCLVFLLCRYRRRIGQLLCCRGPNTKPHPTKSLDDSRLSTKWRPASPTTWAAGVGPSVSLIGHHAASTPSNRFSNGSEYHKACTNEEECFMRAVTLHNSLKPFPRTEL